MAQWTNNNFQHFKVRDTGYNKSVCLNWTELQKVTDSFDNIFNSFVNFTDTIASLQLYPFNILPYRNENGINLLKTSKGTFPIDVYKIDYSAYYTTLGEFYVKPYFNNFADYKGYTQIKVFLPLMGFVDVDVNECMGKWLQFRLSIDFYSGKGMYIIGVSDNSINIANPPYPTLNEDGDMRVISTFECDVGIDIPLGKSNIGDIKRNMLLGAVKTIAAVGAASYVGSLAPAVTTTTAHTEFEVQSRGTEKGSRLKTTRMGESDTVKTTTTRKPVDKSRPISEAIDGSIDTLNRVHIWGNTDRVNDAGLMWSMTGSVKVVIYRPKMIPTDSEYDYLYGKPYGAVNSLGKVGGYTTISNFHLEGTDFGMATETELGMLHNALMDGVILPKVAVLFYVNDLAYTALSGDTWATWIDDGQGETFHYDANGVYDSSNNIIQLNGVNVKSTDVIQPTIYSAIPQVVNFYVGSNAYTAIKNNTWQEWITNGQGTDFTYDDTSVKNPDGYTIQLEGVNVLPTDVIQETVYSVVIPDQIEEEVM